MACGEVAVRPPAGAIHTVATATARRRAARMIGKAGEDIGELSLRLDAV
jgi:hypothetical protein